MQLEITGYIEGSRTNQQEAAMNDKDKALSAIIRLREMGYAITIFSPEEMPGLDPRDVQNAMLGAGNECIADFSFDADTLDSVPEPERVRAVAGTEGHTIDPHFSVPVEYRGRPEVGVFAHKDAERAFVFRFQSHQDIHNFLADTDNRAALLWVLAEVLPEEEALGLIENHIDLSEAVESERASNDWTMSEYADKALHRAGAWLGQ